MNLASDSLQENGVLKEQNLIITNALGLEDRELEFSVDERNLRDLITFFVRGAPIYDSIPVVTVDLKCITVELTTHEVKGLLMKSKSSTNTKTEEKYFNIFGVEYSLPYTDDIIFFKICHRPRDQDTIHHTFQGPLQKGRKPTLSQNWSLTDCIESLLKSGIQCDDLDSWIIPEKMCHMVLDPTVRPFISRFFSQISPGEENRIRKAIFLQEKFGFNPIKVLEEPDDWSLNEEVRRIPEEERRIFYDDMNREFSTWKAKGLLKTSIDEFRSFITDEVHQCAAAFVLDNKAAARLNLPGASDEMNRIISRQNGLLTVQFVTPTVFTKFVKSTNARAKRSETNSKGIAVGDTLYFVKDVQSSGVVVYMSDDDNWRKARTEFMSMRQGALNHWTGLVMLGDDVSGEESETLSSYLCTGPMTDEIESRLTNSSAVRFSESEIGYPYISGGIIIIPRALQYYSSLSDIIGFALVNPESDDDYAFEDFKFLLEESRDEKKSEQKDQKDQKEQKQREQKNSDGSKQNSAGSSNPRSLKSGGSLNLKLKEKNPELFLEEQNRSLYLEDIRSKVRLFKPKEVKGFFPSITFPKPDKRLGDKNRSISFNTQVIESCFGIADVPCVYCGGYFPLVSWENQNPRVRISAEHWEPKSLAPALEFDSSNILPACNLCNNGRGNAQVGLTSLRIKRDPFYAGEMLLSASSHSASAETKSEEEEEVNERSKLNAKIVSFGTPSIQGERSFVKDIQRSEKADMSRRLESLERSLRKLELKSRLDETHLEERSSDVKCHVCNLSLPGEVLPFPSCKTCAQVPAFHHGRCCQTKAAERRRRQSRRKRERGQAAKLSSSSSRSHSSDSEFASDSSNELKSLRSDLKSETNRQSYLKESSNHNLRSSDRGGRGGSSSRGRGRHENHKGRRSTSGDAPSNFLSAFETAVEEEMKRGSGVRHYSIGSVRYFYVGNDGRLTKAGPRVKNLLRCVMRKHDVNHLEVRLGDLYMTQWHHDNEESLEDSAIRILSTGGGAGVEYRNGEKVLYKRGTLHTFPGIDRVKGRRRCIGGGKNRLVFIFRKVKPVPVQVKSDDEMPESEIKENESDPFLPTGRSLSKRQAKLSGKIQGTQVDMFSPISRREDGITMARFRIPRGMMKNLTLPNGACAAILRLGKASLIVNNKKTVIMSKDKVRLFRSAPTAIAATSSSVYLDILIDLKVPIEVVTKRTQRNWRPPVKHEKLPEGWKRGEVRTSNSKGHVVNLSWSYPYPALPGIFAESDLLEEDALEEYAESVVNRRLGDRNPFSAAEAEKRTVSAKR